MSFTLAAGVCYVQGTASTIAGLYELLLDTTTTLTCTTSDPTNPRIDSVIAVVVDNGDNTSTYVFKILAGTPAGSPVAPTLPANALRLCNITVGASVSTLSAGVFTDQRVWSVAVGGVLPLASTSGTVNGSAGAYVDDLSTGRLKRLDGSGNARSPKVLPFAPQTWQGTTNYAVASTGSTIGSTVSVTTDGVTEVRVQVRWSGIFESPATVGDFMTIYPLIDGAQIDIRGFAYYRQDSTSNNYGGGGCVISHITPSAGTHTFAIEAYGGGSSNFQVENPSIRVDAVPGS